MNKTSASFPLQENWLLPLSLVFMPVAGLLFMGCGSSVREVHVRLGPPAPAAERPRPQEKPSKPAWRGLEQKPSNATRLEQVAYSWLGTPYRYGGTNRRGIDCSAFVRNVYQAVGIELPRTVKGQVQIGTRVKKQKKLRLGDLVFFRFRRRGSKPDHVGIYLGDQRFIHASKSRGVTVDQLDAKNYRKHFWSSRRVQS